MYNYPKSSIYKFKKNQNRAARIVKRTFKYDSITPTLKELHWLPIEQLIKFKVAVTTYKSLNGMSPQYLKELHKHYKPNRTLRSSKDNKLLDKYKNTKTHGNRAYEHAAAEVWNKL